MRILMVIAFNYPHIGGLSTYVDLLRQGLEEKGHEVEVLSLDPTWNRYQLYKAHKSVPRVWFDRRAKRQFERAYPGMFNRLPDAIKNIEIRRRSLRLAIEHLGVEGYDVVHAQDIMSNLAVATTRMGRHTPLLVTVHGSMTGEHFLNRTTLPGARTQNYFYALEHFGSMAGDVIVAPSEWMRTNLTECFDVESDRIQTIAHGADLAQLDHGTSSRTGIQLATTKKVILNVQRLDPSKGHTYLLEALKDLKSRGIGGWQMYIAGGGIQGQLQARARQMGLQHEVHFLGPQEETNALLQQADIVVLPSLVENYPYSVIEAQLAGKPVVGFATSGVAEMIVDGETGLLAPTGDSTQLANHLERLLTDEALRTAMSAKARERAVEIWDYHRMVDDTVSAYKLAQAINRTERLSVPRNLMHAIHLSRVEVGRKLQRIRSTYDLHLHPVYRQPVQKGRTSVHRLPQRRTRPASSQGAKVISLAMARGTVRSTVQKPSQRAVGAKARRIVPRQASQPRQPRVVTRRLTVPGGHARFVQVKHRRRIHPFKRSVRRRWRPMRTGGRVKRVQRPWLPSSAATRHRSSQP